MTDAVEKRFSRSEWATLIQDRRLGRNIARHLDSIVARAPLVADFIDSIDP
jgi:hypothetical protein